MENPNNGGTNSDRKEISDKGSKPSDKGSWPLSNNGQRPTRDHPEFCVTAI
tara:strand:+ start:576 stop:728 length:153 start_codon:yes stop_codon:yes gene_type:complete